MPYRNDKSGKPSGPYKNKDGKKPSFNGKRPAPGKDFRDSNDRNGKPYKKRENYSDDPNEIAPPRFLPPKSNNSGYDRRGSNDNRGNFNAGRNKNDDRKFSSPYGRPPRNEESKPSDGRPMKRGPYKKYDREDDKTPFRSDRSKRPPFRTDDKKTFRSDERKPFRDDRDRKSDFKTDDRKPFRNDRDRKSDFKTDDRKPFRNDRDRKPDYKTEDDKPKGFKPKYDPQVKTKRSYTDRKNELLGVKDNPDDIRLNKYIANSGVCSRREADELIKQGLVSVNGTVVTEMGYRVKKGEVVKFDGRKIIPEPFVYVIMNKPKDFITTTDDEKGRKTVMDLLADKIPQRVYPIGRLDRNTTGVLLMTNDGEVAQALTHPSFQIKKVYHVVLDKKVNGNDLDKLVEGIELEDGMVHADGVAYVDNEDKRHVGIEIHSGKNRVVRRMFEHLGYEVEKLDRVSMGIFTKKDLPRGKWRFMTQSEVGFLMKLKSKMP